MSEICANTTTPKKNQNWGLLLLYCACCAIGSIGSPFLQRLYYTNGGSLKWLISFLQFIGFLAVVPPLVFLYFKSKLLLNAFLMDLRLFFSCAFIGFLYGLIGYFYATGLSCIPVSTSSLLISTQLAFTALFAFLIVKQKLTFYSVNTVFVITLGALLLGLHTSSDRPAGVTSAKYLIGFFFTLGGAALLGFISPLSEFVYLKSNKPLDLSLLLQVQVVMNTFSTLFCIVGMSVNNDFKVIPNEAKEFALGEGRYYLILVASAITAQLAFVGGIGVIMCKSSFFLGVFTSGILPIIEAASVIIFHEKFTGEKGLSLALSLWGFASYFLGEFKMTTRSKHHGEKYVHEDSIMDGRSDIEEQKLTELVRS